MESTVCYNISQERSDIPWLGHLFWVLLLNETAFHSFFSEVANADHSLRLP